MKRSPITKEGYAALREELARLKKHERPKIIAAIEEARGHGDLSENAEYIYAKERQAFSHFYNGTHTAAGLPCRGKAGNISGEALHEHDPVRCKARGRTESCPIPADSSSGLFTAGSSSILFSG